MSVCTIVANASDHTQIYTPNTFDAASIGRNARQRDDGKSKDRGVSPLPNGTFQARIGYKGNVYHLGVFPISECAAGSFNEVASLRFGEFARLNVLPE
ncbi:hypothetical protein PX52LOC_01764 [Limnoglobus roseus]|uniref:Uncharacterized protein n=2 Tax=Limnoglobus roseus TaxID=2598579 RepID=A0A5C1A8N3_9BACT|nr:hypothetical protein PX52LOC_01764 [Limnoglobus roseus]